MISSQDFADMSEADRRNYTSVLTDAIEQAKVAVEFLKQ
jgi:hypothetical protein